MNIKPLQEFLNRPGVCVERNRMAFIPETAGHKRVDCYVFRMDVSQAALEEFQPTFRSILASYPDQLRLEAGPSYTEVGAALGDQSAAIVLFGLGELYGLWKVVTPLSLGYTEPRAAQMAAGGGIMITGYQSGQHRAGPAWRQVQ
jgi:hypothetical protein